jgi:hypothetical protein
MDSFIDSLELVLSSKTPAHQNWNILQCFLCASIFSRSIPAGYLHTILPSCQNKRFPRRSCLFIAKDKYSIPAGYLHTILPSCQNKRFPRRSCLVIAKDKYSEKPFSPLLPCSWGVMFWAHQTHFHERAPKEFPRRASVMHPRPLGTRTYDLRGPLSIIILHQV